MGFEMVKEKYTGGIKELVLGKGAGAVKVGGEGCLPFYQFEGEFGNKPKIAMEVWDMEPPEWPEAAREPYKDVLADPAAWAKKCATEFGADMIVLQLKSTDPNEKDASPDQAVKTVKSVLEAISVPLVVWGTANVDKDSEVLKKIAESFEKENLVIGPVEDANHKAIGAAIMGFGHTAISSSPIDINLAKQINILLENLGLGMDKMIIDPTTGGLGYGMEYSYSVMERIKLAAMTFGDDKLQLPIINNLANEVWKSKEAKQPLEEDQTLGDPERRAVMMEAVGAVSYLMAGSNILIMRHPEAVRLVRSFIDHLAEGGTAEDVAGIKKLLPDVEVDYAALAPEVDLTIKEEAKKAPPKKSPPKEAKKPEAPKEEAKKPEPAAEPVREEPAKSEPARPEPAAAAAPATGPALGAEDLKAIIRDTVQEVIQAMRAEEKPKPEAKKETKEEPAAEKNDTAGKEAEIKARLEADAEAIRKVYQKKKAELGPTPMPDLGLDRKQPERTDKMVYNLDLIHKRA
ncbi:MAG: acetyl-CoA decarbonylase/synthase complex subunit delta [Thermodesulfobacteriota bacterium]